MGMNRNEIWRLVVVLFLGQLVSLFLAVASFTSSYIADLGVDAPLTQSLFTYLTLAVVYGATFLYRRKKTTGSMVLVHLLGHCGCTGKLPRCCASCDAVVKAYQYSSITSVTLLDCWTIPWVIILTMFILRTRYSLWQFFGAAVCVLGLGLVLISDAGVSGGGGGNPLLGDSLVIVGTFCYAFSNVGEEYCVKKRDRVEVVTMLGVFGVLALIRYIQGAISLFAGFAAATFLFYTVVPYLLKMSGATLFNLSLLTSDMWAVLIRIFVYHQQVDWLYYLAFIAVAVGLIIYSLNDATVVNDEESSAQYEPLTEGNSHPPEA